MIGPSLRALTGDADDLRTGWAQSGINISTCLDLELLESSDAFQPGKGKSEMLQHSLDVLVEDFDGLDSAE